MAEYIKRNDVIDICEGYSDHCLDACDFEGKDIAERIEDEVIKIPAADVVEVVRCKDCKYYDEEFTNFAGKHICNYWHQIILDVNGFCSYGAKMDGDEKYD